jgi:hypothetical protein
MKYKTLEEALDARLRLQEQIASIDLQLGERATKFAVGRSSDEDYKQYLEWKTRACRSKAQMISRLNRVKRAIAELRTTAVRERIKDAGDVDGLLRNVYSLAKSLVAAGADISQDEQLLLDDVQHYIEQGLNK